MFGYGVKDDPYYIMSHELTELNSETYGNYVGFFYSVTFAPSLLFVGHLTQSWNRKLMVGIACFAWGLSTYLHSYATSMTQLYILRMCVGLFSSMSGPATYSMITDFFDKKYRIKAFFVY
jgi:MFS family permease